MARSDPPDDDLAFLTVRDAGALIAARALSPVALTEHCLRRIEALDPRLNAFLLVTADRALSEARAAERDIAAGRLRGPLHGIPFGLKDVYDTAGIATTGNSPAFRDRVPARDANVMRRLEAAGAILLGKQATHELTYGGVSAELPWRPPRNPWDPERDTGGSSSGSGAAVAAGLCVFAVGTDTGGSVRNPAAHCGLIGLKPSFGLIGRSGVMMNSATLDHCGPLARTAEDCALVLGAIAGFDPDDADSLAAPVPDYAAALAGGIAGWRVGLITHLYERDLPAPPDVRAAMTDAIAEWRRLGAVVEEVEVGGLEHYAAVKATIQRPEIYSEYAGELASRPDEFGAKFRARVAQGRQTLAADYLAAQAERRRLTTEIACLFERFDLLVTAGPYAPAPLLADAAANWTFDAPEITVPFSLTRVPALSLPIGFTPEGMPLSMQVVGPAGGDAAVLRAAHAYQSATEWHRRRPPLAAPGKGPA